VAGPEVLPSDPVVCFAQIPAGTRVGRDGWAGDGWAGDGWAGDGWAGKHRRVRRPGVEGREVAESAEQLLVQGAQLVPGAGAELFAQPEAKGFVGH